MRRRTLLLGAMSVGLLSCARPVSPTATTTTATTTSTASTTASATSSSTGGPKRGGVLRMRSVGDPTSLDLYDVRGGSAIIYIGPVINNLITENPYKPGEIIPELAERWDVSQDGKSVTFTLRQGVLWHDGQPFTSADVLYNLNRAWKPPAPEITSNAGVFRNVVDIAAPDARTVKVA